MVIVKKRTEEIWETWEFPSEASLQKFVLERLNKLPHIFAYKASDRFKSGIHDIICCVDGKFVSIELKVKHNKPTALQLKFGERVVQKGNGVAGYAWTWGDVKNILKNAGYDIDRHISTLYN